ncbi:MAG: hypothetical protein QN198_02185 [Armatimonadota bacterium]|nr:hypothetical protein [Armatimonadota bacterium]MDR5702395.1 hypothetical protein [Armatimonadota bacterium]
MFEREVTLANKSLWWVALAFPELGSLLELLWYVAPPFLNILAVSDFPEYGVNVDSGSSRRVVGMGQG